MVRASIFFAVRIAFTLFTGFYFVKVVKLQPFTLSVCFKFWTNIRNLLIFPLSNHTIIAPCFIYRAYSE